MNTIIRNFMVMGAFLILPIAGFSSVDLTGNASVNVTSDTASTAKNMAFKEARRQIATDVLSKYSDTETLKELLSKSSDDDLTTLISSTSIDGERLSSTTYSANIKMTIDAVAAKKWLNDNNIQNWLGGATSVNKVMIMATLPNGLADWIEINRNARTENIDVDVKRISGGQVIAEIPAANRSMFTIALREAGWSYSDDSGVLRIWK